VHDIIGVVKHRNDGSLPECTHSWNIWHYGNRAVIIIIIIIIIIIFVIAFMQVIYNYIPETNYVSSVYSVAAVPYIQFMLHVMLFCA
jgi:hypothetical protein